MSSSDCTACMAKVEFSKRGLVRLYGIPCVHHGFDCPRAVESVYVLIADSVTGKEWNRLITWELVCDGKQFERLPAASTCYQASISTCTVFDHGLKVRESEEFSHPRMSSVDHHHPRRAVTSQSGQVEVSVSVVRSTYSMARCVWVSSLKGRRYCPKQWMVVVTNKSNASVAYFYVNGSYWHFDLPVRLAGGAEYKVEVKALQKVAADDTYSYVVAEGYQEFHADLTVSDLEQLYAKASVFASLSNNGKRDLQTILPITPCNWFYRNKPDSYFRDIIHRRGGIMEVYLKDQSGDPASPLNGKLNGLFFMAKNENGQPPAESAFGPTRLQVPANYLLKMAPNLYFADFYCMTDKKHYVTLVMTIPYSQADEYCKARLPSLNINENPFLFRRGRGLYTVNKILLSIEMFYTENINITEMLSKGSKFFSRCPAPVGCKGRSSPRGIPKNPSCEHCNFRSLTSSELSTL